MSYRWTAPLAAALMVSFCFAEQEFKAPRRAAAMANPVRADQRSLDTGKRVYCKECQSCHGATGKGDGPGAADLKMPPSDLSDSGLWNETDGELFWKITQGSKPMPTFARLLSDEQRWHVVNYIRTLAPKPTTRASSDDGDSK
jgi:mono/diheme cytochrome c family protein